MKLELTTDLVPEMTLDALPEPGVPSKNWRPAPGPNYLVYDKSRKAPTGFAVHVGKKASVYLVEKLVASELTLGQVWEQYIADLTGRSKPIKANSLASLKKGRDKLKDWEDRKVRLITGQEILDRFDLHAVERGHKTAAEAMGRWATSAVAHAIDNEVHNAHSDGRALALAYNPFTIPKTKKKYRDRNQLGQDYKAKGARKDVGGGREPGRLPRSGPTHRDCWSPIGCRSRCGRRIWNRCWPRTTVPDWCGATSCART